VWNAATLELMLPSDSSLVIINYTYCVVEILGLLSMHSLQERRFFFLISTYVQAKSLTYQGTRKRKLDHAPPQPPPRPLVFWCVTMFWKNLVEKIWSTRWSIYYAVGSLLGACYIVQDDVIHIGHHLRLCPKLENIKKTVQNKNSWC